MNNLEIATLGGGCFWCVEAVFQDLKGVEKVVSGYEGGKIKNPTYREICSGMTGHAEVIQVHFDPSIISFEDILKVFFTTHDPTTLNRQGADRGTQYRSVIFYHSENQKSVSEKVIKEFAAEIWSNPIVTEVSPTTVFYEAEAYHQNYYKNHPNEGYCSVIIAPKVAKVRKLFSEKLR